MIPILRLGIYMVSAKMHNIFNDANLPIKQTNEKVNTKTSIKILDIQINESTEPIIKTTVLQNNINYNTWWLVHISKESKISEIDKSMLIDFITVQFDTFKPDEIKYLDRLVTCSEKIILYFLEFDKDRPYADIKACMLYTTTEEGAFIHYLCIHGSYRSFGIGTFMMLTLQSQLNFRGKKISLHLQANNTTSAYRYYHNINFCKTQDFPKCIEEVLDKALFDKLAKMTLNHNISKRFYYYLPDNIQICKTKNNEILPLETIALKDNADSKTFFVFPFNCSGHEIENMLYKNDFCWLHWSGFYEKGF
jgi:ribosomal protein S18 acetylase RimI-like enzyme